VLWGRVARGQPGDVVVAVQIAIMQGYLVAGWPEQDSLQVVEERLLGEA